MIGAVTLDWYPISVSNKSACEPEEEMECRGSGRCIRLDQVCNGVNDCGEWEDEPKGQCNNNECAVNNGGCSHTCVDQTLGFKCTCNAGYFLTNNTLCQGNFTDQLYPITILLPQLEIYLILLIKPTIPLEIIFKYLII